MKLTIIVASTRPGRIGDQVGKWIHEYASAHSDFEVVMADLAEINLPLFNEPGHPMARQYEYDHTKRWSDIIGSSDAFVVVTPEYNYTMPPSLVNAVDYLHHEWKYKPVAFVGYGGTGAVRAIQTAKLLFVNLSAMPIPYGVTMSGVYAPAVTAVAPNEQHEQAADKMLIELRAWAEALRPVRDK